MPSQADAAERLEGLRAAHYEAFVRDRGNPAVRLRLALLELASGATQSALEDLADAPAEPRFLFLRAVALARHAWAQPNPLDEEEALVRALGDLERIRRVPGFELPARYWRARIRCALGDFGPAELLLAEGRLAAADAAVVAADADGCGWGEPIRRRWRGRQAARLLSRDPVRAGALAHSFPLRALWFLGESLDAAWRAACGGRWAARDSILATVREQAGYLPGEGRLVASSLSEANDLLQCSPDRLRAVDRFLADYDAALARAQNSDREGWLRASEGLADRAVALGLGRLAAQLRWGRSDALQSDARIGEALAELRSMDGIAVRLGDAALRWTVANELRALLADLGRIEESREMLEVQRAIARRSVLDPATFGVSTAFYRYQIGDSQGARDAWAAACRQARRQRQELAEMRARESLAFSALNDRDPRRARQFAEQVFALQRRRSLQQLVAQQQEAVCHALVDRGHALALDPADDLSALEAAIDSCNASGFRRPSIEGRLVLARALSQRGRLTEALAAARAAQSESRVQAQDLHWRAVAVLGEIQFEAGNVRAATQQFEAALREVEQAQAGLAESDARASFLLSARGLVDQYIDALLSQPQAAERSWSVDERGRQHWIRELSGSGGPALGSRAGRNDDDLHALQLRLAPGTVVLKYRVQPTRTLLWVLTADSIRQAILPIGESELASQIGEWRQLTLDRFESTSATGLYASLVAPAQAAITPGCELLIVPDGVLALLPFHAMRCDDKWLLQLHPVKYAVSGRAWVYLNDRAKSRAEQPPREPAFRGVGFEGAMRAAGHEALLPRAELEVTQIAALFPGDPARVLVGQDATPEAVRQLLEGGNYLHLACHTGLDPFGRPALSLSPGSDPTDPASGLVTAAEFSQWPLSGYDLVVLSACATATDPSATSSPSANGSVAVSPLGGLHSLGTAAFVGGAGAVIASLWSVEDESTHRLMVRMYGELLSQARTPAEALRAAQLGIASGPGALPHERVWGAFCVYGP